MASAGAWIKRKWHDPVWSKVIANTIWALPSLFLWSRSQFSLNPAVAFAAAGAFISTSWSWLTMPLSIPRIAVWLVLITAGCLALVVAWLVRNRMVTAAVPPSPKPLLVVTSPEPVAHTATEEQIMRFLAMRHEQSDRFPSLVVARHLKLPKIAVDDAIASLRARNWLWDQSGSVMLSEVGKSVAVKNNWHKDELLL